MSGLSLFVCCVTAKFELRATLNALFAASVIGGVFARFKSRRAGSTQERDVEASGDIEAPAGSSGIVEEAEDKSVEVICRRSLYDVHHPSTSAVALADESNPSLRCKSGPTSRAANWMA